MKNCLFSNSDDVSVKICGLRDEECIEVAVGSGADAIGFVFIEESPRHISRKDAEYLLGQIPGSVSPVAVLKNYSNLKDFNDWPGYLQLCGEENEEEIESINCPVIKAFEWNEDKFKFWNNSKVLKAMLVDGSSGGLGQRIDLEAFQPWRKQSKLPIILAGGLNPKNVRKIIDTVQPDAVDASTGLESERGIKSPELICDFLRAVKG